MESTKSTLQVNGETQAWLAGESVAALLKRLDLAPESVATALNGEFLPRERRADTLLKAGDSLTLFKAIVGG